MARASKASAASKKASAKKSSAKKSSAKAATKKKAATEKVASKKAVAKRTAAKKAPAKKVVAKKAPAKKTPAKKSPAKKVAANKAATKTAPVKKAPAEKAPPEKAPASAPAPTAKGRAKRPKSPFDSRFLEQMRKLLVVERATYERQAGQLRAEAQSLVDSMEPGDVNFDEEGGEGDTIAVERNRDLALAEKAVEMIEEIDHAMSKFELGTYGICEVSGDPIPEERLEAIPWARELVEHKVGGFGRR